MKPFRPLSRLQSPFTTPLLGSGDCDDIDECAEGTADCQPGQSCRNQPGAFSCVTNTSCTAGYQFSYVSRACQGGAAVERWGLHLR